MTAKSINGLSITSNNDGTFNVVGTATTITQILMKLFTNAGVPSNVQENAYQEIPKGKYIIGSSPVDSEVNKYIMSYRYGTTIGGSTRVARILPNETTIIDNTNGDYKYILLYFTVWTGQTVNLTVNPYLKKV